MVNLDIILISICIICIRYTCANFELYERDPGFTTTRPISGFLSRSSQRSILSCAMACSKSTQCMSFFYTGDDKDCQQHADVLDLLTFTGGTEVVAKTLYYVSRVFAQPSTTTQTPTTTTQTSTTTVQAPTTTTPFQFDCSSIFSGWTEARLPSGITFHVRSVQNNTILKEAATNECTTLYSSGLPKINTVEKIEYYRTVILQCPGVVGKSYWVDGSNTIFGDWIWRTSDGVAIPLSQGEGGLWVTGRPNGLNNPLCLFIWYTYDNRLDDVGCDNPTIHAICELE